MSNGERKGARTEHFRTYDCDGTCQAVVSEAEPCGHHNVTVMYGYGAWWISDNADAHAGQMRSPNAIRIGNTGILEMTVAILAQLVKDDPDGDVIKKVFKRLTRKERNVLRHALRDGVRDLPDELLDSNAKALARTYRGPSH